MKTSHFDSGSEARQIDNELHRLFLEELADLLSAEQQLVKALPKMIKAAQSPDLKEAIEQHLEETRTHVERLEQAAESVGVKLKKKTCLAMQGLIDEAEDLVEEHKGKASIDAAIIAAAQKVEHYEIASYGTVRVWADEMEHTKAAELLRQTLDEESNADEKLSEIAQSVANEVAQCSNSES
jgi:ferritin-like metal-binding protein YciE